MENLIEARGINSETASRLGWQVSGKWLEMPIIQHGKIVGRKKRTLGATKEFTQDKGTPQILYNWDALAHCESEELIITEGEMDCAIALQCGFLAVSVPNGAPMEKVENEGSKYNYLQDIPRNAKVVLAFDDDSAGHNLLHDVAIRLGKARCKWVKYPKGCKDLNDAFLKYGAKGVQESIRRASWMQIDGVLSMDELPPEPELEIVPCPVVGMDELYKIRLGDFTVITGVPGMGKTTFANEVTASIARFHDWKVAIASFEQSPLIDHRRWLRTYFGNKPAALQTPKEIEAADKWINDSFKFLIPKEDDELDLHWLLEKMEAAVVRYGCKLIVVDPWNELDHTHPREMTQTEYTGFAIKQFKKFAKRLKVHIIVVTHPAKMSRNKDGEYPMPSLYDIADSAHWRNKADMGIIVHRDGEDSIIRVQKCRYWGLIGKCGEARVRYNDYISSFLAA